MSAIIIDIKKCYLAKNDGTDKGDSWTDEIRVIIVITIGLDQSWIFRLFSQRLSDYGDSYCENSGLIRKYELISKRVRP